MVCDDCIQFPTFQLSNMSFASYTDVFEIEDSEIPENAILPTLQIFRLYDVPDEKHRLHHGYQILFNGDPRMAIEGHVTCKLISATEVVVELPGPPSSFTHNFQATSAMLQRKKKTTHAALLAHASAVGRYQEDTSLMKLKYLLKFDKTGETLTNSVYSPGKPRFGAIHPKSTFVSSSFTHNGKTYSTTEIYAAFNIARVEKTVRMAIISPKKKSGSLLADDLDDDESAGMNTDESGVF